MNLRSSKANAKQFASWDTELRVQIWTLPTPSPVRPLPRHTPVRMPITASSHASAHAWSAFEAPPCGPALPRRVAQAPSLTGGSSLVGLLCVTVSPWCTHQLPLRLLREAAVITADQKAQPQELRCGHLGGVAWRDVPYCLCPLPGEGPKLLECRDAASPTACVPLWCLSTAAQEVLLLGGPLRRRCLVVINSGGSLSPETQWLSFQKEAAGPGHRSISDP